MARFPSTGRLRLLAVPHDDGSPGIAVIADPTVAELTAEGVIDLSDYVTRTGIRTPLDAQTADAASIKSRYNATVPESFGGQPVEVDYFRDDESATGEDDLAWDTFPVGSRGHLVIFRAGMSGTENGDDVPAEGDKCEVWPYIVLVRRSMDPETGQSTRCTVVYSVPSEPEPDAIVAAAA